jgi:hypothetical protein
MTLSGARADPIPSQYRTTIDKGLQWLAKTQHKDGHWGDRYPVAMTGMAGLALLAEGSTIRSGKYADNIRRAVDWLLDPTRTQRNGLIANPDRPNEHERYMYGHGFATLFLASVYGDEETKDRQQKLKEVLTRAVKFIGDAQSSKGGWWYLSAKESGDQDEGSVTITQLQALRACRNAHLPVDKKIIDRARKYLERSTTAEGAVTYSLRAPEKSAPLTAAAIACGFNSGEYDSELVKKWIEYCRKNIPLSKPASISFHEYAHYYYAQAVYILGDDRYARLFPKSPAKDRLTWTSYRKQIFAYLKSKQTSDGSWTDSYFGPVYPTAAFLTILQLDKGTLPIYQR